jgi:hypothetical protein
MARPLRWNVVSESRVSRDVEPAIVTLCLVSEETHRIQIKTQNI